MTMIHKQYAKIGKVSELIEGTAILNTYWDDTPPEPTLEDTDDHYLVYVPYASFGTQGLDKWLEGKKAVIIGGEFDSWTDRHNGLQGSCADLEYDGSNQPTLSLSSGLANSDFRVIVTPGIHCTILSGTFNGSGEASALVKVTGPVSDGGVIIIPDGHNDFKPFVYTLTIV